MKMDQTDFDHKGFCDLARRALGDKWERTLTDLSGYSYQSVANWSAGRREPPQIVILYLTEKARRPADDALLSARLAEMSRQIAEMAALLDRKG